MISALEEESLSHTIVELARAASIEINVQHIGDLDRSVEWLPRGAKVYVSHLPRQQWTDSIAACTAVRRAGFEPVPHIPVRLLPDIEALDAFIRRLRRDADVEEVLLIGGDYSYVAGPFESVANVLNAFPFVAHGVRAVSLAGHPEGHPKVTLQAIRQAEHEKSALAARLGLSATLLTQFFFEAEPFLEWTRELRNHGVSASIVAGLAGPADAKALFKFALRCGVGPSMRALVMRPGSALKLVGDHGPEALIFKLAAAKRNEGAQFDGIHLFSFGGFLRTCRWLHAVANGRFQLNVTHGFRVLL